MRSLRDIPTGRELVCVRNGVFSRDSELLLGDEVVATFEPVGMLGSRVEVDCADGRWIIERKGWFGRKQVMTEDGRLTETARFENESWSGHGSIVFPDGRSYAWRKTSFWSMRYAVEKDGVPLVRFEHRTAWFKTRQAVTVEPAGSGVAHDLPVLIVLGCHLVLTAIAAAQAAT